MPEARPKNYSLAGALVFGLLMLAALCVIHALYESQEDTIQARQTRARLDVVNSLLADTYSNDPVTDTLQWQTRQFFSQSQSFTVYRARQNNQPAGLVLMPLVGQGYNGPIRLALGLRANGSISGIRILSHEETPGLGAGIDQARSNWLEQFLSRSLGNPPLSEWRLAANNGHFDSLSGATVSSRAVVSLVRSALEFHEHNKKTLFKQNVPP